MCVVFFGFFVREISRSLSFVRVCGYFLSIMEMKQGLCLHFLQLLVCVFTSDIIVLVESFRFRLIISKYASRYKVEQKVRDFQG